MRTSIILMATIFLTLLNSCSGQKKETRKEPGQSLYNEPEKSVYIETIKNNFQPVLDNFIDLVKTEHSDSTVFIVVCYQVFDKKCIILGNDMGYNLAFLKGYTEYKDFLICYYGVDDHIAEKLFNFENLEKGIPNEKYENLKNIKDIEYIIFDPIVAYYLIDNMGNIDQFKPSSKISKEMEKLSIEHGFSLPPPPLPEP